MLDILLCLEHRRYLSWSSYLYCFHILRRRYLMLFQDAGVTREHKFSVCFPVDLRSCLSEILSCASHHHRLNGISSFEEDTIGGHQTGLSLCGTGLSELQRNVSWSASRNRPTLYLAAEECYILEGDTCFLLTFQSPGGRGSALAWVTASSALGSTGGYEGGKMRPIGSTVMPEKAVPSAPAG